MNGLLFALVTSIVSASEPDWSQLDWGGPLPEGAEEFVDLPWAGAPGERCVQQGETILCADASGLRHAHRPFAEAVSGGERTWLHTAGFEWTSGYLTPVQAPPGLVVERWGPRTQPLRGWESARRVDPTAGPAPTTEPAPLAARPVELQGAKALGPARAAVEASLSRCGGAPFTTLPVAILYDPTGEARMVRLQGFPPEGVDMACVASALGAPRLHPERGVIELMLSLGEPPEADAPPAVGPPTGG
ncbi:MAG: hypothetical protein H6741_03515 [Alphaproteobacteria bacterium]|nr:hypothetical protein [Alphaproteobacteria bacterium]MCB9791773.1 hypothetical protein [Alphaproteobacteria bacterium]